MVEAAIAAGLIAPGLNSALAVPATLLFRHVHVRLPRVPGRFVFPEPDGEGVVEPLTGAQWERHLSPCYFPLSVLANSLGTVG